MKERTYVRLLWAAMLVAAPLLLVLSLVVDIWNAWRRLRFRGILAAARGRARAVRDGGLELDDGHRVEAREIVRAELWVYRSGGDWNQIDEEESWMRFETADGASYMMPVGYYEAAETIRSLGLTPGRVRDGGKIGRDLVYYTVIGFLTFIWLLVAALLWRVLRRH